MKVRISNARCPFCCKGVFIGHPDQTEERRAKSFEELFNFCDHVAFFCARSTSELTNIKSKIVGKYESIMFDVADVLDYYHEIGITTNQRYKRQLAIEILEGEIVTDDFVSLAETIS